MASALALISALLFALAAGLQQRGEFRLAEQGTPVHGVGSLLRLLVVPVWLVGTLVLFCGYATQAAALDQGRLVVIQPLLVSTVVWALPVGWWLTGQHVTRRQILGAVIVVVGLTMFVRIGDPDHGRDSAPAADFLIAVAVVVIVCVGLMVWASRMMRPARKAGVTGMVAGLLFGVSATFAKPLLSELDSGIGAVLDDWRLYGLVGFVVVAFGIQQLSLATGQFAPAMAAVAVANPLVSVILGVLIFEERLTRPSWHVVVAVAALFAALAGAVMITLANRDRAIPEPA